MNKNESISYTEMQKFFAREIKEVGGRPITSKNLELSLLPIHARENLSAPEMPWYTEVNDYLYGVQTLTILDGCRLCIPGIYAFTTFHLDIIYCCILIL